MGGGGAVAGGDQGGVGEWLEDEEGRGRKTGRTRSAAAGVVKGPGGGGGAGQWRVFRSAREFVRQLGLQVTS